VCQNNLELQRLEGVTGRICSRTKLNLKRGSMDGGEYLRSTKFCVQIRSMNLKQVGSVIPEAKCCFEFDTDASAAGIEHVSADSQQSSNSRAASERVWDKARLEPKEDRAHNQDDQWLTKRTGCLEGFTISDIVVGGRRADTRYRTISGCSGRAVEDLMVDVTLLPCT
jgi:hypothetical protein